MYKIERLGKHHDRTAFNCGSEPLNRYLQTMASQHAKKGMSQTHVLTKDNEILGFYSLSAFGVSNPNIKGLPLELPCVLLGRMGVSTAHQGQGHANRLMINAIERTRAISQDIGVCFLIVDLKHRGLISFYEQFGFKSFDDSLRMYFKV